MTKNSSGKLRFIYGVLLSISIFLAGICLMAACLTIYRSGDQPFSREAVAAAFAPISAPVYLCLFLVLLGFPLNWLLPREEAKRKAGKQDKLILRRLHEKTELAACDESLRQQIFSEAKGRKARGSILAMMLILTGVVFGVYILTGDRFVLPDINGSMVKAMTVLLPCLIVTFIWAVYAACRNTASVKREIGLIKQANAAAPKKSEPAAAKPNEDASLNRIRGAVVLLAVALIVFGYCAGGSADVLTKAINICTECVGLG